MLSQINEFVNWVRRRNPQARTWRDYSYDLHQFADQVGERPPNQVTLRDVDRFVNSQVSRGYKPATINRRLAAILALFNYMADEDPTLVCPVLPHRHYLREPQRLPRPVQEEALEKFFSVIQDIRDCAMFLLMLRCGLRISEVANLLRTDLFLRETAPRLVVHGKGSRERSVYLSPQAERALYAYLRVRPPATSEHVFLSYLGKGLSTTAIHKRLMHYRQLAGVQITCHRLRHSFANDLLSAGVPVTSIQQLLGHRWLETTQIYVQANDQTVQADYYAACLKLEGWSL
jgi:site-specific recombinase XerD